jgi:hypothetical protein
MEASHIPLLLGLVPRALVGLSHLAHEDVVFCLELGLETVETLEEGQSWRC